MQQDNRTNRMLTKGKPKPSFKFWLEYMGKPILGRGGAQILLQIEKDCSISSAAKNLDMSYRYVWDYVHNIGTTLGEAIVETHKGGKSGGGGAKLTELGKTLLIEYDRLDRHFTEVFSNTEYGEVASTKISARNRFKGKVTAVQKGGITAEIKVRVVAPTAITAIISGEVVEGLEIKVGDEVEVIVKATDVIIAK